MSESKWYLRTQNDTFGPEAESKLVEWAKLGRIQPGQEISDDNVIWRRVEDVPFLDMRFSIDIGDGNPRCPFNRAAAEALLASGRLPKTSTLVEVREPFPEESVEKVESVEKEQTAAVEEQSSECGGETPPPQSDVPSGGGAPLVADPSGAVGGGYVSAAPVVEPEVKVVEKIVEVPVEKVVEKEVIKEVRVEVPVEKIVVDETRVKELEGLLAEERRHTTELQGRLDESLSKASEASKAAKETENALRAEVASSKEQIGKYENSLRDAADRENKYAEQVKSLEDELRRLPQAASEVADIQAAVYSIITDEAKDLECLIDKEKGEFEEIKKRHAERTDRLQERRRELLKRSGANLEDMTRRALLSRPEDPRTAQLRRELEELRRTHEHAMLDNADKVRALGEQLRRAEDERKRTAEGQRDVVQLQAEVQTLRELVQAREKELMSERQRNEELVRQQATKQQTLLARLATLESPSIGTSRSMSTNQSREAKLVRIASWLKLK